MRYLSLFAIGSLCACSPSSSIPATSVRDSAGVTIVENRAAAWTDESAWTLAAEPALSIGALEGPEEYQLFRVSAALRLPNGTILVANSGTNEIRFYDASGQYVKTVGREGAGPGEFQRLGAVWRLGADSLVAVDRARRLLVFDIDGNFGRTVNRPTPPEGVAITPQGVFDDASVLMWAHLTSLGDRVGQYVDSIEHLRYAGTGELLNRMARRPRNTLFVRPMGEGGIVLVPPFIPTPSTVVQHERWFYGEGADYEIERYTPAGRLTHLYRRTTTRRPVTPDMADDYRDGDDDEDTPPQLLDIRKAIDIPSEMPAYSTLRASTDGTLWVQHYTLENERPRWSTFSDEGRYLGDVDVPLGASVLDIGSDYWLLLEKDELDVEYVRMYELLKGR